MLNEGVAVLHLKLPVESNDLKKLSLKDIVYLDGVLVTMRDRAHLRALEILSRGEQLPFEVKGRAIYHCGPLAKRIDGQWKVLSAGPTTSLRLEGLMEKVINPLKVNILIGKGGVGVGTIKALKGRGVYLAYPGGVGALAAKSVKRVLGVYWMDLGMAEAVWVIEVKDFGPCIVAVDVDGRTLFRV